MIPAPAERLGIAALAEGAKPARNMRCLAQMGRHDEVQGYAIARPMPLTKSLDFLASHADAAARLPTIGLRG